MPELNKLFEELLHSALHWEVLALLGCLALAYGICWGLGRGQSKDSIWFGRVVIDGVLFPLLSLALTFAARAGLRQLQSVPFLRLAVTLLVALAVIRFLARVLTVVFPNSGLARLVERLFSWMAWGAAVLWVTGLLPPLLDEMEQIRFSMGATKVSLLSLVEGALSAGAVLVATLWISAALERKVLRDSVADLSLRKVAGSAIRALLLLVGFLFVLSAIGVDLTALSVLGGALGVGLGFGLQKLAANYVSGFVILFERSLRMGDTVRVDGFDGVVVDIKTRYTLIRALDGRESIVPNEMLITQRIENLSLADTQVLLSTAVTVSYDSDIDQVQLLLLRAAQTTPRVLADPPPVARLVNFGADGLELHLTFWIADPHNGQSNVRSDVNLAVLKELRAASIEIPYPQRVLHMAAGAAAAESLKPPKTATKG